ncbi:unnamed protein product [Caretta caretta]
MQNKAAHANAEAEVKSTEEEGSHCEMLATHFGSSTRSRKRSVSSPCLSFPQFLYWKLITLVMKLSGQSWMLNRSMEAYGPEALVCNTPSSGECLFISSVEPGIIKTYGKYLTI